MAFVVTIEDLTPPPRTDQVWTQILLFESDAAAGPWGAAIQTFLIATDPAVRPMGLDDDPTNPQTRMVTTTAATAETGKWYSVVFKDTANNSSQRSTPTYNGSSTTEIDYRPTVRDVAELIRARTVDEFDNELGTFTSATTPTASQVEDLITDSVEELFPIFGADIPDAPSPNPEIYRQAAAHVVATRAAAMTELTHFGKEVARGNSPFDKIMDDFNRTLLWLATKLGIVLPGGATGDGGGAIDDRVPLGSHVAIWGDEGDLQFGHMSRPY